MKTTLLLLIIVLPRFIFCQPSQTLGCSGFDEPFNWSRSTDSRSEAMGLTATTTTNNSNTSYYNPGGLGTLEGIQGSVTYATPYYNSEEATFLYTTVAGKINDFLKVQLSRFAYQGNVNFVSENGDILGEATMTAYTLGVGTEPLEGWYFGGNLKLIEAGLIKDERSYTLMGDLGFIKRFELAKEEGHHSLNIGASVMNFTANELKTSVFKTKDTLDYPVIGFGGISYEYATVNKQVFESLDLLGVSVQADYINQFDLKARQGYRFGTELALMEMVYLRGGYYYLGTCDFGFSGDKRDNIQSVTYGVGVAVPFQTWTKLPLTLNIDYANMQQPTYLLYYDQKERFTSINAHLTWEM